MNVLFGLVICWLVCFSSVVHADAGITFKHPPYRVNSANKSLKATIDQSIEKSDKRMTVNLVPRTLTGIRHQVVFHTPSAFINTHLGAISSRTTAFTMIQHTKQPRGTLPVWACVLVATFMIIRRRKHLRG